MIKYIKLYHLILSLLVFPVVSCDLSDITDQDKNEGLIDDTSTEEKRVDYESDKLLAKFDTENKKLPIPTSFLEEINKASGIEGINYSALDSMFKTGTDIHEVFSKERGGGVGFSFSLSRGFSKSYRGSSGIMIEFSAIDVAFDAYQMIQIDKSLSAKSFNLIHFLLSRGIDPNTEGKAPLFKYIQRTAHDFKFDKTNIINIIDLYKFYNFNMENLDLSACDNEEKVFEFLVDEGSKNYDMNTFDFDSDLIYIYNQKESLMEKGVIFDFSQVDGHTFPFESDTSSLLMMFEMGLSPNHITPEGKTLRSDFGTFSTESLTKVLDKYQLDHPE